MDGKLPATPIVFGFDIGIASVGWAVLAEDRIVALGVRTFDKAETPKEGAPLNLVRRTARLTRRRLRRRAWRLKKLARTLKRHGVIPTTGQFGPDHPYVGSLWHVRVAGLDRRLDPDEWARVLYHICKHRGFHWSSRAEEQKASQDTKGEAGKVKAGLADSARRMTARGYRTAAEMVLHDFPDAQRNKRGEYTKALARTLIADELALLFSRQRELGNPFSAKHLELEVLGNGDRRSGLFWSQKPPLAGSALLQMLGRCTFERDEYRAPKASFTAERHVWLTRLNNLRIIVDGRTRPLNDCEREVALPLPYVYDSPLSYGRLRTELVNKGLLPESFRFAGLPDPVAHRKAGVGPKDPESAILVKLPGWHELRLTFKRAGFTGEWQQVSGDALAGKPEALDSIAWVLSVYKDDDEVRRELTSLNLPGRGRLVEALLNIRFDRFHALSLKALRAIVPNMARGMRYDEACAAAGYRHSVPERKHAGRHRYIPPLYSGRDSRGTMVVDPDLDVPRNPVVLRSLNQARKVLNALIRNHGSPHAVHIELARDLSRPYDERRRIEKEQAEFRERNAHDRALFAEHFLVAGNPRGGDFEKWRLYREQQGKCAYSIQPLDLSRILEPGYVEVDHVLPYSRSFDDSKNNKVLVLSKENRDKGNLTPFEYLDGAGDGQRWRTYVAFVEGNKQYRLAKRNRLLRRDFGATESAEFQERNLNDTRYVCRFFKNLVENSLTLADKSDAKRCVVLSGQLTSFLRARWGLIKVREESDRHHALDAAVVAACSHFMVKRLSDYARRRELAEVRTGFVDVTTGEIVDTNRHGKLREHFPEPWPQFRDELLARLSIDDELELRTVLENIGNYSDTALAATKPLFVSRAPQRRNSGAAHKETVYGQSQRGDGQSRLTERVPLSSLSMADLDRLADLKRNEKLYDAIRNRMRAHGGKGDKAFSADNPLRKPGRDGSPSGPIVRSVTLQIDKMSGISVRGGLARNDVMLRVDVFSKTGKFYLVPVYVHHRVNGLPNHAVVANKSENEWTLIDATYQFCFSLYPNDLVSITQKGKSPTIGYFAGCDRNTGAISLWAHDRNSSVGKDGLIRSLGPRTATSIKKFDVDVLGNRFAARREARRGLA
ncbi:MAG: type II CRISPR RNA-guided endonuclease Cas9 [Burkholderiales bacterium]|nr:type II CRISPR RNA-guided endonuclease Cas9 [Burkholderiales bacterium]